MATSPAVIINPPEPADADEEEQVAQDLLLEHLYSLDNLRSEAAWLIRSSIPIVVSSLSQLLVLMPVLSAVGGLGTIALASMNLVSVFVGICGVAPLSGLPMALDTMCSQAFTASKDRRLLGLILQRVLVCLVIWLAIIYPIWWNSEYIYEYVGVSPRIAAMAGELLRMYFIGISFVVAYECLRSYLFAQGIRRFAVIAQGIVVPICWFSTWLLISNESTSLGILGVSCIIVIVGLGFVLVTLSYIYWVDGSQCWGGWTIDAFTGLIPVFKLGLAGSSISLFELVSVHIIDVGAMFLTAEHMAAQSVLSALMSSIWIMGSGFAVVACNRVGNLLGSQKPNHTKMSVNSTLGLAVAIFGVIGIILSCFASKLPYVFTSDKAVIDILYTHVGFPIVAGTLQGINMSFNGILRGMGRQVLIARIRIISFLFVAIPLSLITLLLLNWKLAGLWISFLLSLVVVLLCQAYVLASANWDAEVERCHRRVSRSMLISTQQQDVEVANESTPLFANCTAVV